MKDVRQVRANERIRAFAAVPINLGTALLAAGTTRLYFAARFDPDGVLWLIVALFFLYIGWLTFALLTEELDNE